MYKRQFNDDTDLLAGFKETYQTDDLEKDLLLGLLLRVDGPQQIQALHPGAPMTLAAVQQVIAQRLS